MQREIIKRVRAWIKRATKMVQEKGKYPYFIPLSKPLAPEHCPCTKAMLASGARCAKNDISLWRRLCGNIPFYSLFNFFPDQR